MVWGKKVISNVSTLLQAKEKENVVQPKACSPLQQRGTQNLIMGHSASTIDSDAAVNDARRLDDGTRAMAQDHHPVLT